MTSVGLVSNRTGQAQLETAPTSRVMTSVGLVELGKRLSQDCKFLFEKVGMR